MPVFDPGVPWLRGTAILTNGSTTVTTDGVITLNEILEGDRLYVFDGGQRIGPFEIVGGEDDEIELRDPFEGATGSYAIAIDRNPITRTGAKTLRDVADILGRIGNFGELSERDQISSDLIPIGSERDAIKDALDVTKRAANLSDLTNLKEARSNLGTFSSVAEVQSRHIPAALESIRTNGYYSPGDGGGALLIEGSSGVPGAIQDAGGRWFELAERQVTPEMFGAVGDGVTDDTAALIACFASPYLQVHLPNAYLISETLESSVEGREITCVGFVTSDVYPLKVLRVTGDNTRVQINIRGDGASITDGVHVDGAAGCEVYECRIVGLTYKTQISASIRADTTGGVIIRDNYIEGWFDPLDNPDTPGGENEVARAIVLAGDGPAEADSIISRNRIIGAFDPKTSCIQLLFDRGDDPLFAHARCLIQGNTLTGFNRRGLKVQASGVSIIGNVLKSTFDKGDMISPATCIDLQYCEDVEVLDNIVSAQGMSAFTLVGADGRHCKNVQVSGNRFALYDPDAGNAASLFRAYEVVFTNNYIHGGGPSLQLGFLKDSVISGVTFTGDGGSGSNADYCIVHNNMERCVIKDILHASGNRTRLLAITHGTLTNNLYDGLYGNMTTALVSVGTNATNNIIRNVVSFSGGPPVTGTATTNRVRDFISTSGQSLVGAIYYVTGDPSTETPDLHYSRGDVALSRAPSPGTPMGWVCTVSGAPGTWRPLADVGT